ncbi:MAG TPA: hypothetical protein VH482_17360 [Thermomicrobiales bacterium]|jgi:hypothetical protein
MWIFTKQGGFLSVVAHDTDPHLRRVRARKRAHLEAAFPNADIIEVTDGDYRWHADVPWPKVAWLAINALRDMDYTSHVKEAVAGDDDAFYEAMLGCWRELWRIQHAEEMDEKYGVPQ